MRRRANQPPPETQEAKQSRYNSMVKLITTVQRNVDNDPRRQVYN